MSLPLLSLVLLLTGGNLFSSESQELPDDQQEFKSRSAETPAQNCMYQSVIDFLGLTNNNNKLIMSRPTLHHANVTPVTLSVKILAILDVRESDQTFICYIWIKEAWDNPHVKWNEDHFCGISALTVPVGALWKPDLTIAEMIEKDKAPPSPFLKIKSKGVVEYINEQVVFSTCGLQIYRFPFDILSCNISFKSVVHSDDELNIQYDKNSERLTEESLKAMESQYEWVFKKQSATKKTVHYAGYNQTVIVYSIRMKRRSSLYVANFVLPLLFFLCLDLFSLLMPEDGEKIGFKVTVLLSVTVMQLILIEILPVSSDSLPLIVIYCIGIFALMLLSLLETILVKYLMEKDSTSQDRNSDNDPRMKEEREIPASVSNEMTDQTSSVYKEGSSSQLTELVVAVEKVSDELGLIKKKVNQLGNPEPEKSGYWTDVANRINKVFPLVYITAVVVFLGTLFPLWILDKFESANVKNIGGQLFLF